MRSPTPRPASPRPTLYLFIFGSWVASLLWFHPRLMTLLDMADTPAETGALLFFIIFTEIAWLYAWFNVGVIIFASIYRWRYRPPAPPPLEFSDDLPAVAILYTTANDFVEESALSCVRQHYPHFTVYILDDSSDPDYQRQVDDFAGRFPGRVRVVRRPNRKGFKAGNVNHGLTFAAVDEPFFALADADEIFPTDFLTKTVAQILSDDTCGFVQANHRSNPDTKSPLARGMGPGIDIHWKWYHPLRNRYGFVMLLGHGALLRRECWEQIGGFPELVSEDLAFALRAREHGWRGYFMEDVVCYEDFPETVRAFRVRHMKWTRGTCEFLQREMWRAVRSRKIPLVEKFDVFFPTLNLPFSLLYFLFVVDANLILTSMFGHTEPMTLMVGGMELTMPIWRLEGGFAAITGADFFLITVLTLLAPILCFIIDMARRPRQMFRFLARSTALYGALGPLSCLGVFFFLMTGKAIFHVTADRSTPAGAQVFEFGLGVPASIRNWFRSLFASSHPDNLAVQGFELACAVVFGIMSLKMMQVSFFGVSVAFLLLPLMHRIGWNPRFLRPLVYLPFVLILAGLFLGGMSLMGVQTVLFGFGFHF